MASAKGSFIFGHYSLEQEMDLVIYLNSQLTACICLF